MFLKLNSFNEKIRYKVLTYGMHPGKIMNLHNITIFLRFVMAILPFFGTTQGKKFPNDMSNQNYNLYVSS